MKTKISILLFATMMAGSLSAQIETFSESDNFVSAPRNFTFDKSDYLPSYNGSLSPCGGKVLNIIGEQLYCKTQANINSTQYNYVLVKNKEGLVLMKIQQGKYYTVKDILISKEQITRLQAEFNNLPFISDTLHYNEVNEWSVAQLLDKTQLPKRTKKFLIPKEDILSVLYNKYRKWPTEDSFKKNQSIELAIFVLRDDNGNEYYVPKDDEYYKDAFTLRLQKSSWPNPISFYPGYLAGISNFIIVKGFTRIKQLFENKRIVNQKYDYCNSSDVKICKKIAIKDGKVMAAVTDTLSTTISYLPITDIRRRALSWCKNKDSLVVIQVEGGMSEYCTLNDRDSIEAKIAYAKQIEKQRKIREDEHKKQELIQRYGVKIGQSIADGKACVGMNKEQCIEAIGTPNNITKSTSNLGDTEIWTYSLGYQLYNGLVPITVVSFLNNVITSVDVYKGDSPF